MTQLLALSILCCCAAVAAADYLRDFVLATRGCPRKSPSSRLNKDDAPEIVF